jgi:hypothetical protein
MKVSVSITPYRLNAREKAITYASALDVEDIPEAVRRAASDLEGQASNSFVIIVERTDVQGK